MRPTPAHGSSSGPSRHAPSWSVSCRSGVTAVTVLRRKSSIALSWPNDGQQPWKALAATNVILEVWHPYLRPSIVFLHTWTLCLAFARICRLCSKFVAGYKPWEARKLLGPFSCAEISPLTKPCCSRWQLMPAPSAMITLENVIRKGWTLLSSTCGLNISFLRPGRCLSNVKCAPCHPLQRIFVQKRASYGDARRLRFGSACDARRHRQSLWSHAGHYFCVW